MKRMIEKQLLEWKNNRRRKPLILRGARQVGKTWSIKKLGSDNFENTIHLDLEKNHNLHSLFKGDLSPGLIVQSIEVLMNAKITSGKTLLFIDEIQSCPRAVMSLRYFYEEMPDLHVIAAGSLLEFSLGEISFPVGRIQYMQMAPMSFSEYLEAGGNNKLVEIIHSKPQKLPEPIHNLLLRELKTYFFIGGMPKVSNPFIKQVVLWNPSRFTKIFSTPLKMILGNMLPTPIKIAWRKFLSILQGTLGINWLIPDYPTLSLIPQ